VRHAQTGAAEQDQGEARGEPADGLPELRRAAAGQGAGAAQQRERGRVQRGVAEAQRGRPLRLAHVAPHLAADVLPGRGLAVAGAGEQPRVAEAQPQEAERAGRQRAGRIQVAQPGRGGAPRLRAQPGVWRPDACEELDVVRS